MPISAADLELRFSTLSGGAGNTAPSGAGSSNGKYVSQTPMTTALVGNLFPAINGVENAALNVDYQCAFLVNKHASIAFEDVAFWIEESEGYNALIAIAADPLGPTDISYSGTQAASISDKDLAPSGVGPYNAPTDEAGGIELGTIGPGQACPFWVRRTAVNSPPTTLERHRLRFKGKTVD